jgi:DNA damage-binding protein 1
VSPVKSLTYLDNGVVFVGSHDGDSQLVKLLTSTSVANNSYVQVVETLPNLAPIMDAAVVHDEQTNQVHPSFVTSDRQIADTTLTDTPRNLLWIT